ncbi:MAG: S8 family serine peptidase [Phycisphaerales bacterium]
MKTLMACVAVCGLWSQALAGPNDPAVPDFGDSTLFDLGADGAYHPSNVLLRFNPAATGEEILRAFASVGMRRVVHKYRAVPGLMCIAVEGGRVDWAIAVLSQNPAVKYAERDYYKRVMVQETPYGIPMVGGTTSWAQTSGLGAKVAVLDTGVDLTHPDLPAVLAAESFITGEAVDDLNTHGTHCSGTVLALDNDIGVVGVAPTASLLIGKVLGNSGSGATSGVMAGCQWALDQYADVISMSLGGGSPSQAEEDLYQAITDAGTLIVAAAGNANSDVPSYPGSYPSVMCVAAVDADLNRAGFSNFGSTVDISGPGVGVLSTIPQIDSSVAWNNAARDGNPLTGSQLGSITAQVYSCGEGLDAAAFPAAVAGNIAHIRRGGAPFAVKTQNAIAAGAVGVVISNNAPGNFNGTLNGGYPLLVLSISQADGDELQTLDGTAVTLSNGMVGHTYAAFSGTSMATPHVAGVVALLVGSREPGVLSPAVLRQAIEATAQDLGDPGRDDLFGHGLARADLALAWLDANHACPADWNQDGVLDENDMMAFFEDWDVSDADFNRDGGTDGDDLIAFFTRWNMNC